MFFKIAMFNFPGNNYLIDKKQRYYFCGMGRHVETWDEGLGKRGKS